MNDLLVNTMQWYKDSFPANGTSFYNVSSSNMDLERHRLCSLLLLFLLLFLHAMASILKAHLSQFLTGISIYVSQLFMKNGTFQLSSLVNIIFYV